jgi:(1->4)-alpha-D-glucan 1-alpha-D-glucosylmutase
VSPPEHPGSTYRLQLHAGFGFDDAAAVVGYLDELGVTHAYCSPYLQAAPGSTHGYDVVDHRRVNEELGGDEGRRRFSAALREHGLGQVLDIVPNHMAIAGRHNAWWWDVLTHGPASRYASYFDIDWAPPEPKLAGRVLLPILTDHYGRVLEGGGLRVERREGEVVLRAEENELPLDPGSLGPLLGRAAAAVAAADAAAGSPGAAGELAFVARSLRHLPVPGVGERAANEERRADVDVLAGWLGRLLRDATVAAAVDAELAATSADPDRLHEVLEAQHHRLSYWRTAERELDYRRFFDIDTLVGLRVEDPAVFVETHGLVLEWIADGSVSGLRIDHPDGLRDPGTYLERLHAAAPAAWIVVEKILEGDEELPASWPVAGTTGYDFLNLVGGLAVDPAGEEPLTHTYAAFVGDAAGWDEVADQAKLDVLGTVLSAELGRLTQLFVRVCEQQRRYRDFTRHELHEALRATLAAFGVYRAYVGEDGTHAETDRGHVNAAVDAARERRGDLDPELFDLLGAVLLAAPGFDGPGERELRMRFQQQSGPVMAKGLEDTAFYRYGRLTSLNEVGGDPGRFGTDLDRFHRWCLHAAERRPHGMLTLATHDTKRSPDVRARLSLLSQAPERWASAVHGWHAANERLRPAALDPAFEYFLYQTLVGAHPLPLDRALAYAEKAAKEAKVHTSWTAADPAYDGAVAEFLRSLDGDDRFQRSLAAFVEPLVWPGRVTSLAQQLVALTAPGVPDTYQGSELWDLSLVDPDNRRPVDYALRRELLDGVRDGALDPLDRIDDGTPKLWVTHRALQLRRRRPDLFAGAPYRPVHAAGERAAHVVAFSRGDAALTVAPRLALAVCEEGWGDTTLSLPPGRWTDELRAGGGPDLEGEIKVGELLGALPVALLVRS